MPTPPLTAEAAVGSPPPAASSGGPGGLIRRNWLLALGAASYLMFLLVTLPAQLFLRPGGAIAASEGTIWKGSAGLAGGERLSWRWRPVRSLLHLGFAVDWRLTGGGTDLFGAAVLRRRSVEASDVRGRAEAGLLSSLVPALPFTCTARLQVDLPQLRAAPGDFAIAGTVTSEAGTCQPKSGPLAVTLLPPLILSTTGAGADARARLTRIADRERLLMELSRSSGGRPVVAITPAGLALFPLGVGSGAPLRIEL